MHETHDKQTFKKYIAFFFYLGYTYLLNDINALQHTL